MSNLPYNFVAARNADLYRLPRLLSYWPHLIKVRDVSGSFVPLTNFATGPFTTTIEDGYIVLCGTRVKDEETACLRIVERGVDKVPYLQWKERIGDEWRFDETVVPLYQLFIPDQFLVAGR